MKIYSFYVLLFLFGTDLMWSDFLELWIRPCPCLQVIWSIQISSSSKFMFKTLIRPDPLSPTEASNTSSCFHVLMSHVHFSEAFTNMWRHPPKNLSTEDDARSSHAVLPRILSFLYLFFFFLVYRYVIDLYILIFHSENLMNSFTSSNNYEEYL